MSDIVVSKEDKTQQYINRVLQCLFLTLLGLFTIILSCSEIIAFKIFLDNTQSNGAVMLSFAYFVFNCILKKVMYEIQIRKSHHLQEYTEYLVPTSKVRIIAILGALYYVIICFMTPHLQATHLVVLMQCSCVFTSIAEYFFKLVDWTWVRSCQFGLGLTSLILIFISLYVNRATCCEAIVISTLIFTLAVVLNSFSAALTTHTLLNYPSMQVQFEYNVYKYQCYYAIPIIFVIYAIRTPTKIDFVDLISFFIAIGRGFIAMLRVDYSWVLFIGYLCSGLLYDWVFSYLVFFGHSAYTSCIQVIAFLLTLVVMWNYESQTEPTHDPLTVVSFVLFSGLLFWEGVSAPVFRTHRGSFFENRRESLIQASDL